MKISSVAVLALAFAAASTLSFAQTAAPAAAPATPAPVAPVATPAPATTTETTTPAEAGPRPATYTLQQGDTLESVGKQWGLTGRQLQKYNKLTNAQVRRLQIGKVIKIPPATK